jgi:hypothetical protein
MKYHNNAHPYAIIVNPAMELKKVVRGRFYMFYLGIASGYGVYNYDVFQYKTSRGLARWKKRVTEFFSSSDGHGHGHAHEHGHGHEQSNSHEHTSNNSKNHSHAHSEVKDHGHH